jgi:hypothetical protein
MMRDMLHLPSREDAVELIEAGKWDELKELGTRGLFPNRAELGDWYVDTKLKTLQAQGKRGQAAAKLLGRLTADPKYSKVRSGEFPPFDIISQEWVAEHPTAAILPLAITAPTERLAYEATHPETWPGMAVMLLAGRYVIAPAMRGGFAWLTKQGWATQERRGLGYLLRKVATRLKSKKMPLTKKVIRTIEDFDPKDVDPRVYKAYKDMPPKARRAAWKAAVAGKPVRVFVPRGGAKAPAGAPIVPPAPQPAGPIAPEMALALRGEAGITVPPVVTSLAPEVPGEIVPTAGPPAERPVAVPEVPAEGLAPGVPVAEEAVAPVERPPVPPEIAPPVEPETPAAPGIPPTPEEAVTPPVEVPTETDAQAGRYKTREDYAAEMKDDVAAAHDAAEAGFVRVPGLQEFSELGNRIRGRMGRMLEPQRDVVRDVHGAIEKWRGETNLAGYYTDWSQEILNKIGVPKNEGELITRAIDNPDKYGPEFEKLPENAREMGKLLEEEYEKDWNIANQAGVLDSWRENYINRIYKDNEARIRRALYPTGGQLGKGFRFARQRKFETLDEAEAAGLHPILDPIVLNGIYKYQLYRAIANRNLVQMLTQLKREDGLPLIMGKPRDKAKLKVWDNEYQTVQAPGLAKYMWVGETGEKGMLVKIPAKADPEIAKVLNDVFSPWTPRGKWSQGLRAVRGRVKRVVMLNPAIHSWNIFSDVIDEVNFNPYAAAKVYVRGHQLYKAKDALVEDALTNGLQMTTGQHVAQRLRQEAMEIAPAMRGVLEPIGKLEQLSDKWLWSGIVRNAQLGLYEAMTKELAKKHPDWSSEQAGQTAATYINTNLGTLPWTWMSKGMREAGSFFFFARNWTFSNPDMVVKAASFGRKGLGMKALTPEQQTEVGTRFSKHLFKGMIGLIAFTNLVQLAFLTITNKMKEDGVLDGTPVPLHTSFQNEKGHWMDVDTGLATKTGQRIYIVPPLFRYMRDYIGYGTDIKNLEGRTLWNKMEPLLKAFGENLANYSVWQRQEIAKPGAPTYDRIKQRARYFVESITPSAYYAKRPGRVKTKFEYFVPFTGTWIRRGAPGGRFAQLYFEFQKERKYEKDQLDNKIDEALQSGEFIEAIEAMNERYTSAKAKADRITRLVVPLNYFWDTANKKDKALFLAYLKKHNYKWEDFAGALAEERGIIESRPDEEPIYEFPVGTPIEQVPEGTQGSPVPWEDLNQ